MKEPIRLALKSPRSKCSSYFHTSKALHKLPHIQRWIKTIHIRSKTIKYHFSVFLVWNMNNQWQCARFTHHSKLRKMYWIEESRELWKRGWLVILSVPLRPESSEHSTLFLVAYFSEIQVILIITIIHVSCLV